MSNSVKYHVNLMLLLVAVTLYSCNIGSNKEYAEEDIKTIRPLTEKHIDFIVRFYPNVVEANEVVAEERELILDYRDDFPNAAERRRKRKRLNKLADKYRLTDSLFIRGMTKDEFSANINELLSRVDILPEKLVMAQAIIESGWGSSKYAKSINNYFGIHCHKPGCGEPPSAIENPTFWVKSFPTIEDCIEEYIWNLNIGFAYDKLRETRLKLRRENNYPNAFEMAGGLERYSEKGHEYISLVRNIIKNYLPKDLDAFVDYHKNNPGT